jgi:hypothetical protein
VLQHPTLYPFMTWLRLICGISFLPMCQSCSHCCHTALLYLQDEVQFAFHPTLTRLWCRKGRRGQRLVEAPGDNRHPSTALVCWTGAMAGRVAGSLQDAPLMSDVAQVRVAVARSKQRGRVAIVIADNLKTHTAAGSLLVRSLRSRIQGALVSGVHPRL